MLILLQNILFLKQFIACNGCFGLFTKIKKGSWTGFWGIISTWFSHKNYSFVMLYQLTKFQGHIFFPSRDIKQNLLLSSGLDKWWRHKPGIILSANNWQVKFEEKSEILNIEYLENEKSLLDEVRSIFRNYLKAHSQVWNNFEQLKAL